jgi:hypothetical protein
MTTYLTINEEKFVADRADELVNLMHDSSLARASSDQEFMKEMAGRVKFATGVAIRTDDAEAFIADLIAAGYLKPMSDDEEEGKDVHEEK